jgi:hypothetical protein
MSLVKKLVDSMTNRPNKIIVKKLITSQVVKPSSRTIKFAENDQPRGKLCDVGSIRFNVIKNGFNS